MEIKYCDLQYNVIEKYIEKDNEGKHDISDELI